MDSGHTYTFDNIPIKVYEICNVLWFRANDVAMALEYKDIPHSIRIYVCDEDKTTFNNEICLNEFGLYSLVFSGVSPKCETFKEFISRIILSLKKKNYYNITQPNVEKINELINYLKIDSNGEKEFIKYAFKNILTPYSETYTNVDLPNVLEKPSQEKKILKPLSSFLMEITKPPFKKLDYESLNISISNEFKNRYPGKLIYKCERYNNESSLLINYYKERDWPWIEQIIKKYFQTKIDTPALASNEN